MSFSVEGTRLSVVAAASESAAGVEVFASQLAADRGMAASFLVAHLNRDGSSRWVFWLEPAGGGSFADLATFEAAWSGRVRRATDPPPMPAVWKSGASPRSCCGRLGGGGGPCC